MWIFNNEEYNIAPEEYQGFVYQITELDTNKKYIGKKNFWKPKTLPITKTRKRRVRTRIESDWRQYYGCLLYTSPSPRDRQKSRMPSSA